MAHFSLLLATDDCKAFWEHPIAFWDLPSGRPGKDWGWLHERGPRGLIFFFTVFLKQETFCFQLRTRRMRNVSRSRKSAESLERFP